VLIGAIHDQGQPASIFNGDLDEVRIWGRGLHSLTFQLNLSRV